MQIDLSCPVEMNRYSLPKNEAEFCSFTLRNVSNQVITSVELVLCCLDLAGHELLHQRTSVNDLTVQPQEQFETEIRTVEWHDVDQVNLIVQKVWFANGDTWRKDKTVLSYYESNELPNGRDLDHLRFVAGEDAVGYPVRMGNVWVCVCGRPNSIEAPYCCRCARSAVEVFTCFTREDVEQSITEKEEKLSEQGRQAIQSNNELQQNRERAYSARRRRSKKLLRWTATAVAAAGVACFGYFYGWPEYNYHTAAQDLQAGRYDEAYGRFVYLADYKDAALQANVTLRQKADFEFAKDTVEGYELAEQIYTELGDQQDGSAMAVESRYALANLYDREAAYEHAAELYQDLGEYKDSKALLEQVILKQATVMMEAKSYTSARVLLAGLTQTKEVTDKIAECAYQIGAAYIQEGNWPDALTELEPLGEYKQALALCARANYEIAQEMLLREDLDSAMAYFKLAGDYQDAETQMKSCAHSLGKIAMQENDWERALACFEQAQDYLNSKALADTCLCSLALEQIEAGDREAAMTTLASVSDENKSEEVRQLEKECYYTLAVEAQKAGDLTSAEELYEEIGDYADSDKQLRIVSYALAQEDLENKEYERALWRFEKLGNYRKSEANAKTCRYELGMAAMESEDYEQAITWFSALGNYKKSAHYLSEAKLRMADKHIQSGNNNQAEALLTGSNSADAAQMLESIHLEEGAALEAAGKIAQAITYYAGMTDSQEAALRLKRLHYEQAQQYELAQDWFMAAESYFDAKDYEDAAERSKLCFDTLYGNQAQEARDAAAGGDFSAAIAILSQLPLTEKSEAYGDLPLLYKQAQLAYADELYRAGKPYEAMPYYQALGDWENTADKKLNRRAYLILGEWESTTGAKAIFRADGTCVLNEQELCFRITNFSLYTGTTPDALAPTHRLNTISKKEVSLSDLQGKRAKDYHLTRIGEWTLPEISAQATETLTAADSDADPQAEAADEAAESAGNAEAAATVENTENTENTAAFEVDTDEKTE